MKKGMIWVFALVLIGCGAFVMAYGADWFIDTIGALLLFFGAAFASRSIVKNKDEKKQWIYSLVCAWAGVIVLTVAGLVRFNGSLMLAFVGAVLIVVCRYVEFKRRR